MWAVPRLDRSMRAIEYTNPNKGSIHQSTIRLERIYVSEIEVYVIGNATYIVLLMNVGS